MVDCRLFQKEDALKSDEDLGAALGSNNIANLHQVHGNTAVRVTEAFSRTLEADALATSQPGLTLSIRFADCQNALIVAPKHRVICLVHAGWKGVAKNTVSSAIQLLFNEWSVEPRDILVGLGPALCLKCSDFTDPLREVPSLSGFTHGNCVDLRGALQAEFHCSGVSNSQIERIPDCTRCLPEKYLSFRGGDRQAVMDGSFNCLTATLLP